MRPLIGILSTFDETDTKIKRAYADSVLRAGGLPIIIPISYEKEVVIQTIERIDGVILPGGPDVDPSLFNEEPIPQINIFNPILDSFQKNVVDAAISKKIPIFGICRGMQFLNVYFGGSLYQDIKSQCSNSNQIKHQQTGLRYVSTHFINIEKNSLMHKLLGNEKIRVNSLHHQAIKDIASCFKATATSSDGIIEAVEINNDLPIYGVQWHPEEATAHNFDDFLPLFKYLVEKGIEYISKKEKGLIEK
ncbi:Protein NtpR [Tritrichomonas foetus]|uniref:Protein NtpR n=1 Tax=Tritrichomonas foetus TaxID=1144522 RepID=A0A1J4L292_9EUKA|nr:Protein NtpR [Tritrichomonas foetus]|eukprot:OHT16062.1 Protein NtpR [Tritrichomonas foetus]